MADAFNAHEDELRELIAKYDACDDYDERGEIAEKFARVHRQACEDACRVFQQCAEDEREYQESFERFEDEYTQGSTYTYYGYADGRKYRSDSRKWYTADGEFFEQSNVNHECVSIVKRA